MDIRGKYDSFTRFLSLSLSLSFYLCCHFCCWPHSDEQEQNGTQSIGSAVISSSPKKPTPQSSPLGKEASSHAMSASVRMWHTRMRAVGVHIFVSCTNKKFELIGMHFRLSPLPVYVLFFHQTQFTLCSWSFGLGPAACRFAWVPVVRKLSFGQSR